MIAKGIPAGDIAYVSSIDLVFDATQANRSGSVCYGYRSLDGRWSYDLTPIAPTLDASGQTQHAHLPVMGGPMDALEIPFASAWPPSVLEIRFEAAPAER